MKHFLNFHVCLELSENRGMLGQCGITGSVLGLAIWPIIWHFVARSLFSQLQDY